MADITPVNGLKLNLPEILNLPPKLFPIITEFNKFKYMLLEGGRGSGKSHSVARMLLFAGEKRRIRVVCGREIQNNIEESVHALLADLIKDYGLAYDVFKHEIRHKTSGTVFKFKGFREQGNVNIKGLEGVDVLWIDEAQSITKPTLDIIVPTIVRNEKARMIFTMNRFMRDDAVPEFCVGRNDCLHIQINYFENPFCSLSLKNEAEIMRNKSQRDYNHIWMGKPLATADAYLFNYDKLHNAYMIKPFGEIFKKQRVVGIDFAAQGNDQCVFTVLDRMSNQHWQLTERIAWDEPDTTVSTGKIIDLLGRFKPDEAMLDIGGMGKPIYDRLIECKINVHAFDGGSTKNIDTRQYVNIRSAAYHKLKDWFDDGFLCIDKKDAEVIKQLEKIKRIYRSNGAKIIQSKQDMKKDLKYSPDDADSLMMAVWCAITHLGKSANSGSPAGGKIKRKTGSKRR